MRGTCSWSALLLQISETSTLHWLQSAQVSWLGLCGPETSPWSAGTSLLASIECHADDRQTLFHPFSLVGCQVCCKLSFLPSSLSLVTLRRWLMSKLPSFGSFAVSKGVSPLQSFSGSCLKCHGCIGGGTRSLASCIACPTCLRTAFMLRSSGTTLLMPRNTPHMATGLVALSSSTAALAWSRRFRLLA